MSDGKDIKEIISEVDADNVSTKKHFNHFSNIYVEFLLLEKILMPKSCAILIQSDALKEREIIS